MRSSHRLAGIFAIAGLVFAGLASEQPARAQFSVSPGKLSRAHAAFESNCEKCHDMTKHALTEERCTGACHAEIRAEKANRTGFHGQVLAVRQKACAKCHTEHQGRDFDLLDGKNPKAAGANAWGIATDDPAATRSTFDHRLTGFPLQGAHAKVGCEHCHVQRTASGTTSYLGGNGEAKSCVDAGCHTDPHGFAAASASRDCQGCHGLDDWKKRPAVVRFDHARTGFPLAGAHAALGAKKTWEGCNACHVALPRFEHRDKPAVCEDCHRKDDPHKGTFGTRRCAGCHTVSGWKKTTVATADHRSFGKFETRGAHATLTCAKCHTAGEKRALASEDDCASAGCHVSPHKEPGREQCVNCHTATDWKVKGVAVVAGKFDHLAVTKSGDDPGFALTGGHAALACVGCHPEASGSGVSSKPAKNCASCHDNTSPHGAKQKGECNTCHTVNKWKPPTFDVSAHQKRSSFALTGKHLKVACASCHKTAEFKGTATDCESCHRDDHHKGKFAEAAANGARHTACENCHVTDGWEKHLGGAPSVVSAELSVPSPGCIRCHGKIESFHPKGELASCVGCHGGNGTAQDAKSAHVQPPKELRRKGIGASSGNAPAVFGDMQRADPSYIRFINPGDLRVAEKTCGQCHADILKRVRTSIMATSSNVPSAVLYNNGAHPSQSAVFGDAFTADGTPARLVADPPPTDRQRAKGALPFLDPLPHWEATAAPDSFRIFERGNDAGGARDRGTDFKIAGVYLNLVKTRLNDPALWLPGTNDSPGDFRGSGCTGCHVLYANDRNAADSGAIASFGNGGHSASADLSIPHTQPGHPIRHSLTRSIPLSQCLTCHHHQGNGALGNYAGFVWHDQETEIEKLMALGAEPGGAGQAELAASNGKFNQMQFADSHGHKWNFRAVYWTDRRGELLDRRGIAIAADDPEKWGKAVHLKDVHLEKGMQCIDCHGERDMHGDGFLYTSMVEASEIGCVDCHGTANDTASLQTRGAAAGSRSLRDDRTPFGQPVFSVRDGRVFQRSKMTRDLEWEVPQVKDVVTPGSRSFNAKGARAMGLKRANGALAHDPAKMECYSCHSAWNASCFGCHLPFDANARASEKHRGEGESRGYAEYNPQVIRTDAFTLGIDGNSLGNKVSPMRSASAVVVSAKNLNREVVVQQQPTVSSSGLAGDALTPNIPHTVRARQTRGCSDCHPSERGDNNSVLADRLGVGTNAANWMGDFAFVAAGREIAGVRITEGDEPRPVIGSDLHRALHAASATAFERAGRMLGDAETATAGEARSISILGEYALVADGPRGLVVYDIANIANKGVAQKIVKTPATVFGQRLRVATKDAAWVAIPSSMPMIASREKTPTRTEPPVADLFRYAFVADRVEGLVVVETQTLVDGNPSNNFLEAAARFNPSGDLAGARHVVLSGNYALVSCKAGVAVIDVHAPTQPRLVKMVRGIDDPRAIVVQFRYAFVADAAGVEVLDLTDPDDVQRVSQAKVALADARGLVALRDYLYVADGRDGIAIIDITRATGPQLASTFNANGEIRDANAITVATTNASTFAFVGDGAQLRVVSLIEPARVPGHLGFSPAPVPRLIASWKSANAIAAVAEGQKRDRFVDESGNAISVGGRIGSRPFNLDEMRRLFLREGRPFSVRDDE